MATTCHRFGPFDAGPGSNYTEDRWRGYFGPALRNGYVRGVGNENLVYADSTGMQIKVKTGEGRTASHEGALDSEIALAIAPRTVDRFDVVVQRSVFASNLVEWDVLTGPGGLTFPTVTNNSAIDEVPYALVTVDSGSTIAAGKITDLRESAAPQGGLKVTTSASLSLGSLLNRTYRDGDQVYEADTNRWRGYEGAVWRWVGGKIVGWQGNRGTGLTVVSGNWTRPALNDVYDVDAIHAGTESFITIAETGTYRVTGIVNFGANATGGRGVGVNIGSAAHTGTGAPTDVLSLIPAPSTNGAFVNGCDEFDLTAGQVVTFVVMSNGTGVGLDVLSAKFTCTLIGYRT